MDESLVVAALLDCQESGQLLPHVLCPKSADLQLLSHLLTPFVIQHLSTSFADMQQAFYFPLNISIRISWSNQEDSVFQYLIFVVTPLVQNPSWSASTGYLVVA